MDFTMDSFYIFGFSYAMESIICSIIENLIYCENPCKSVKSFARNGFEAEPDLRSDYLNQIDRNILLSAPEIS